MNHGRALSWFVLAALGWGCRLDPREHDTPHYCCTDPATCAEANGSALRPCTEAMRTFCDNHGQFPGSEEVGRTCIGEPGGRTCDAPADCASPRSPVCDLVATQTCVGCAGAADCGGFPDLPLCNPDRGACVECVTTTDCPLGRPLCDPDGDCRECDDNNDCTSQLCNAMTGSCVPEAEVIYVGQGGDGPDCTRTDPCGSVQVAIDHVTATRTGIHVSSGSYFERVTIDGKSFYLASDGAELRAPAAEVGPVVTVTGAGVVELDSIRIRDASGATGDGIDCSGTTVTDLTLRDVLIEDNAAFGVDSSGCRLAIVGSTIDENEGGGVKVTGGDVVLLNDVITRNGSPASSFGGVDLSGPGAMVVDFNTIADNIAGGGQRAGIQCVSALPRILSSNIVAGTSPVQLVGMNCTFEYTLSNEAVAGTGNLVAEPTFDDRLGGNFHLLPGSPGIDVGDPLATLTTDIDGELRPQGARADIGADEVTP